MSNVELIILEGPDGGGKSTLAKSLAADHDAMVVHCGPFKQVAAGNLARLYVEAMMPAVLGYQTVIMDRCWLSEEPYGLAYRNGADRLGPDARRMLERLALRCSVAVLNCLPDFEDVEKSFIGRKGGEYLDNLDQLRMVYEWYSDLKNHTCLPVTPANYKKYTRIVRTSKLQGVSANVRSAGNINAPILLVGDKFGEVKSQDSLYQWPFASFSGSGCSLWLTAQLREAEISERDLCWINSDQPLQAIGQLAQNKFVVTLGLEAKQRLANAGIQIHASVDHPQAHKRFKSSEPYPLIHYLKAFLHVPSPV